MSWYGFYEDDDREYDNIYELKGGKAGKSLGKDGPHIPNKNERKALAEIKRTTGLTEEEIRADKTHRITLADARKMGTISKKDRAELRVWEQVFSELKVAKESKEAQDRFDELWKEELKRKKKW